MWGEGGNETKYMLLRAVPCVQLVFMPNLTFYKYLDITDFLITQKYRNCGIALPALHAKNAGFQL